MAERPDDLGSPRPTRPRGNGTAVAVVVAIGVILVLSMALVAVYSSYVADTNTQRISALESTVRDLSSNEQLIGSELQSGASRAVTTTAGSAASPPSGSSASKAGTRTATYMPVQVAAPPSGQPKVSPQQAALGVRLVLGEVMKTGARTPTGIAISFKPGGYYEGSIAFSVAASHGDVVKGAYYVDGSATRTIDARILSGAEVTVYGWNGSAAAKSTSIHEADLAKVLVGGANAKQPWKSAWYWFEVGPGMAVIKVQQLPPL